MTKINRIVMTGFKSFGKRTELLFGDRFNVVLGPNGSGKSNLLDAVCFVLGKSSSKSMRAEKSANLIYNGGRSKKPASSGEVSIYFDNLQKTFPTNEETVKITRLVRQNGQSIYKINDKVRTRQQILDLMSMAKINPDGYNIILQGDIVRLVEMSSPERRQIIEEISGIGVYEDKKQKTLLELARVEQKLGEADIILRERKAYMRELKKDRDQALKYKELNDRISVNKASYLKRGIDQHEAVKAGYESQIAESNEALEKIRGDISRLKELVREKRAKIGEITKQVEEKGDREQRGLQKDVEKLRVDINTGKNRISSCKNEINRIRVRQDQLTGNAGELDKKREYIDAERKDLLAEKERLEKQRQELEKRIAGFKEKHMLGEGAERIEAEIEAKDLFIEEKQKEVSDLRERQQGLLREKDKLEFQIQTIEDRIKKVEEIEKEHEQELKQLKQKQTEFKKATLELNRLLNSDSTLAAQLAELRKGLMHDKTELAKLEANNVSIKESISGNAAVKGILRNKDKIGTIYGTVSELGVVSSKYSLALEVAAGPKIRGIVVKDDQVAADCIRYLKRNKLGTAHFLPLNKVKPASHDVKKFLSHENVHSLAVNLVKFDPMFRNVFDYIFGDTAIVEDINTARTIGVGRVRMATLDGDLCDISGVMSGGYRERKKGISFREHELEGSIDKLRKKVNDMEDSLQALEKEKEGNEKGISSLRELKATLEGFIIRTEKGLHLEDADLDASIAYKEELLAKQKDADKTLNDTTDSIGNINHMLTDAKVERQQLKNQISELRNPALLAELNAFEQKKSEIAAEVIQIDAKIKGYELQSVEVIGRDRENILKIRNGLDKEERLFAGEIKALAELITSQEVELKQKERDQEKFYTNFKNLYAERSRLNDEIAASENETFVREEEARQAEYRLNTTSLENAKIKAELAGLEASFEPYRHIRIDASKSEEDLRKEIADFEKLRDTIGSVNMRALEIYETVERGYESLLQKRQLLDGEKNSVAKLMGEIEEKKKDLFTTTFGEINRHFQDFFAKLSTKGEASLMLENPEHIFEEGVKIMVKLAGDKFLDIRSLSGGEKTMTALAFLFAIQEYEPAKFYVFDEVDAALDKPNSEKLAELITNYCLKAQYIVISHNDALVSKADNLYGVTMDKHGTSNVVCLKM